MSIYLDDVLIFSKIRSDHVNLIWISEHVRSVVLTLKHSKYEFAAAELDYLGHHIGLGQVLPWEQKVQALIDFPCPTNRKGVRRFLGLAGYFRRFIPHYSESMCALNDLLKKSKFVWTSGEACEKAFLDIKSRLASRPNYDLPFLMAVDASDVAVGACLFQNWMALSIPFVFLVRS